MPDDDALYVENGVKSQTDYNVLQPRVEAIISGEWSDIAWPWPSLNETLSLLPGMIVVVCGDPGATKSFFVLSALYRWHAAGCPIAFMALEGGPETTLQRLLAVLSKRWDVLRPAWGNAHPDELRRIYDEHAAEIDGFAKRLFSSPPGQLRYQRLLAWMKEQLENGVKILCVDPVTFVATGERRDLEDLAFITAAAQMLGEYCARLILVTHPRGSATGVPRLQDISGGMSFSRHTQTVFWLSAGKKRVSVRQAVGIQKVESNRMVHILKATNGTGQGDRIAFNLTETVEFAEQGKVEREHKFEDNENDGH